VSYIYDEFYINHLHSLLWNTHTWAAPSSLTENRSKSKHLACHIQPQSLSDSQDPQNILSVMVNDGCYGDSIALHFICCSHVKGLISENVIITAPRFGMFWFSKSTINHQRTKVIPMEHNSHSSWISKLLYIVFASICRFLSEHDIEVSVLIKHDDSF